MPTRDPSDRISGADKLIAIFEKWPSFHDAEVMRMMLDRGSPGGDRETTLEAVIHTWEMTREVDPGRFYVLRNHVLVHLRFRGIDGLHVDGFNHQNVLFELAISDLLVQQNEHLHFRVEFNPTCGVGAAFYCRTMEVVAVTPCGKDGVEHAVPSLPLDDR